MGTHLDRPHRANERAGRASAGHGLLARRRLDRHQCAEHFAVGRDEAVVPFDSVDDSGLRRYASLHQRRRARGVRPRARGFSCRALRPRKNGLQPVTRQRARVGHASGGRRRDRNCLWAAGCEGPQGLGGTGAERARVACRSQRSDQVHVQPRGKDRRPRVIRRNLHVLCNSRRGRVDGRQSVQNKQ